MKIVGIIPARYESTRFPGKPLIDLKGKSMIQRVYEGASASKFLNEVIVATDDKRIYEHVISFGGNVKITRPEHQSGTDRCGEVLQTLQDVDVVINIQGDEPLINYKQLDELAKAFEDPKVQIATLGIENCTNKDLLNPNRIKLVKDINNDALYFSRSVIPYARENTNGASKYDYVRHIGVYAYRAETLKTIVNLPTCSLETIESLEQLRWMFNGFKIRVVKTEIETPNIDVPADVNAVLELIK